MIDVQSTFSTKLGWTTDQHPAKIGALLEKFRRVACRREVEWLFTSSWDGLNDGPAVPTCITLIARPVKWLIWSLGGWTKNWSAGEYLKSSSTCLARLTDDFTLLNNCLTGLNDGLNRFNYGYLFTWIMDWQGWMIFRQGREDGLTWWNDYLN